MRKVHANLVCQSHETSERRAELTEVDLKGGDQN